MDLGTYTVLCFSHSAAFCEIPMVEMDCSCHALNIAIIITSITKARLGKNHVAQGIEQRRDSTEVL